MDISLQILLFIALLIVLAKVVGGLCHRLGLPLVLGELLAGVILGPTLLDIWQFSWFSSATTVAGGQALSVAAVVKVLAQLGVVVLMFLAGLETDIDLMKTAAGPAFWAAVGGVVLPLMGGAVAVRAAGFSWPQGVFIGTVLTATSVSITAQTLMNLNKLRSKAGCTILGAAVIDDVLGLMVLSFVIAAESRASHPGGAGWASAGLVTVRVLLFSLVAFWLGPRLIRFTFSHARHLPGPHTPVAAALAVAFVFAFLAEAGGGMAAITGAYLAGLFVAALPERARVIDDLRSMTNSFFGPLFFVSIGLEINARQLAGQFGLFLLILLVAVLGKILGCGLGARFNGFSNQDSLIVGVGMIPRGEVGLITASLGWSAGLMPAAAYSLVVSLVLVTTLITPLLLRVCLPREALVAAGALPPLIPEGPESSQLSSPN
jgi:Kef-type K+ transport system membrane component KefB